MGVRHTLYSDATQFYAQDMGAPVWGTFSVRDHCVENAFARELLLFDRLVVPYPATPTEHDRWRNPNPNRPEETWDPDRLDSLLAILGTQDSPGYNGAQLAVTSPWTELTWQMIRSRLAMADALTGDPFMDTRVGVQGQGLPRLVEAVAAYPSEPAWREDLQPSPKPPADISAADALILLPRRLLLPEASPGKELDTLRRVVDLAADPDFADARSAYHDWLRDLVAPLRGPQTSKLDDIELDPASFRLAEGKLQRLLAREEQIIRGKDKRKIWTRVEYGVTGLGAAGTIGLALVNALPVVGALVGLAAFGGWVIGKRMQPAQPRSLGGATMFVEAQRRLKPPSMG